MPVQEVQAAIELATYPELKSYRIQHILRLITERVGILSLDILETMPETEARANGLKKCRASDPKPARPSYSSVERAAKPCP